MEILTKPCLKKGCYSIRNSFDNYLCPECRVEWKKFIDIILSIDVTKDNIHPFTEEEIKILFNRFLKRESYLMKQDY